jgi:tetratricopeptide (TPR) repeat protein
MSVVLSADQVKTLSHSSSLHDKARLNFQSGRYTEAKGQFEQSLKERKQALGDDDQGLAQIADEAGLNCLKLGEYKEAQKYFNDALAILEKNFYPGHFRHAPVLEHLGDSYLMQGQHAEAEPVFKRALEISEKTVSGEHRAIFELIWKLTSVYQKLSKFSDAEALLTKALKQLDTPLGPQAEFRYRLALIYEQLGKQSEASAEFSQALIGLEQRKDYHGLADCLESFARLLSKSGKANEAKEMNERVKAIRSTQKQRDHDLFPATLLRA